MKIFLAAALTIISTRAIPEDDAVAIAEMRLKRIE